MVASIEKSSTQGFRKQKNKIVVRHSLKADMNPSIPDEGEIVFATDTRDLLIGDGVTRIQDLPAVGGAEFPEQTGHSGEFLTTNGSEVSWAELPAQAQADWDQSDTSAPDYIKNKPYIPEGVVVDQTYDPASTNAQSGTAVAEATGIVDTALTTHTSNTNNPHSVTKSQVGLGNVDNTADIDKPISTATQTALDNKVTKNIAITGATKCKITYDAKGLVTAGADLAESDIPSIHLSKVSDVTATAAELNVLDGITATTTELNYTDGVTSNIQTQLNAKANSADLATVATSGSYTDLDDKPTIGDATITIQKNSTAVDSFTTNATANKTINITVPTQASDVNALPDTTKYAAGASLTIDSTTYIATLQLKDQDGNNIGTAQTIDLPLESVVVNGSYDSATKEVVLILESGTEIRFSVADLISGLQSEITSSNMLDADLVDDSTSVNKFVTTADKTNWNNKVTANTAITGATHTKITYDSKGLVTAGADLQASDIPSLTLSKISDVTATAAEVNVLDGITASTTELNYVDGVTSNIQTQLNSKQDTISDLATIRSGAALGATSVQPGDNVSDLVNDAGYLTQHQSLTDLGITATAAEINVLDGMTASTTELNYVDGVTSSIQTQLDSKQVTISDLATIRSGAAAGATAVQPGDLATVATSGSYGDLTNKPTIPAAQVNSDWNANSGIAQILNKPTLSVVATSGDYNDLLNKPYIPAGVIVDQTYSPNSTNAQAGVAVAQAVAGKVDSNTAITGGTATKITYDSKGLVTAGSSLQASDIPDLSATYQSLLVSGTNIKTINNNSLLGSGDITIDSLPSQTDQSGKFLTTDGTNASWATVSSGVTDYTLLSNKPEINGNTLTGNKTASQLGFADIATSGSYTDLIDVPTFATVATSGDYDDLTNKPTIPAAQQQVDWNASSGITSIANKPSLATVATSGSYSDLSNKPILSDFTTSAQQDAIDSNITSALVTQITSNQSDISTINGKIPSAASTSNQLADKAFVNSSISNMAANYVTSDAQGDNFATKAALLAGPYYYKGVAYTLTNNDYALVEADETHSGATTRYMYDGAQWAFQYVVNNAPFSQAQLDAINSTITSTLVTSYSTHIADTTIHVTSADKTTWSGKQDALVSGTNIKTINGNSLLGSGDITVGGSSLPSQTGHSGDFLTTDGTDAAWTSVATVATTGAYSDLSGTPTIPVVVQDFWVDSTTGAITCTFSGTPTTKSVHTIIGNTTINGTWSNNVFTPTTASDILENVNGFVVSVA